MNDNWLQPQNRSYDRLTIEEMIDKAGDSNKYQLRMFTVFFLTNFFAAFIQMGFPIIFQAARFVCPEGEDCTEEKACLN